MTATPIAPQFEAADPDLQRMLRLAVGSSAQAGEMVRAGRADGLHHIETKSSATDVVTEFDRRSEHLIVEAILSERPDDSIVGEEGTDQQGTSLVRWLIDPIDGTTNYLYGLAGYAVSIAAVDSNGPLVGAVYLPATHECFSAIRGYGAALDDRRISCATVTELATALVGTGFSYMPRRRSRQAARVARMIGAVRDIRRFGAAAADLCYVACGRLDVYFEEFLSPWDLAAGQLIATEAGCVASDFEGGGPRSEEVLVCPPALQRPMLDLLRTTAD